MTIEMRPFLHMVDMIHNISIDIAWSKKIFWNYIIKTL